VAAEAHESGAGDDADAATLRFLRRFSAMIFKHPAATQAVYAALVAEGRRFAETEEGARLAESLARSDLVAKARMVWEVLSMSAFRENGDGLPSVIVDDFARAAQRDGIETILSRLADGGIRR